MTKLLRGMMVILLTVILVTFILLIVILMTVILLIVILMTIILLTAIPVVMNHTIIVKEEQLKGTLVCGVNGAMTLVTLLLSTMTLNNVILLSVILMTHYTDPSY